MANVLATWSVKLRDFLGVVSSFDDFHVLVPDTVTLAGLQTITTDYVEVLDVVTDSEIIQITLKLDMVISGAKSAPNEGAENERGGLLSFSQTGIGRTFGVWIPGLSDETIVAGKIDPTNTDIIAIESWFTSTHGGGETVSDFNYILEDLLGTLISFRTLRTAESRRSRSVG